MSAREKPARSYPQPPPDTPLHGDAVAPAGFEYRWAADPQWRLASPPEVGSKRCRRHGCLRPVVAVMNRLNGRGGTHPWAYCDAHLYGLRVHAGRVECRRLVSIEQLAQAEEGV